MARASGETGVLNASWAVGIAASYVYIPLNLRQSTSQDDCIEFSANLVWD